METCSPHRSWRSSTEIFLQFRSLSLINSSTALLRAGVVITHFQSRNLTFPRARVACTSTTVRRVNESLIHFNICRTKTRTTKNKEGLARLINDACKNWFSVRERKKKKKRKKKNCRCDSSRFHLCDRWRRLKRCQWVKLQSSLQSEIENTSNERKIVPEIDPWKRFPGSSSRLSWFDVLDNAGHRAINQSVRFA